MKSKYIELLNKFVTSNIELLSQSKKYKQRENDEISHFDYLPSFNEKNDPDYLGNLPVFKELLNSFLSQFIFIPNIKFDLNGHMSDNIDGLYLSDVISNDVHPLFKLKNISSNFSIKLEIDVFSQFNHITHNTKIHHSNFSFDDNKLELNSDFICESCDERLTLSIDYDTNLIYSTYKKDPCILPFKPKNLTVHLKSPSGKIVFLNDPRKIFNESRDNRYKVSINSTLGCIQETEFYASHNIGFFFISNSMPYIFQNNSEILFASFNEESDEDIEKFKNYNELGYICTGLWWYTVLDYDLYQSLCLINNIDPNSIEHTVATINKNEFSVLHDLTAHSDGYFQGVFSSISY